MHGHAGKYSRRQQAQPHTTAFPENSHEGSRSDATYVPFTSLKSASHLACSEGLSGEEDSEEARSFECKSGWRTDEIVTVSAEVLGASESYRWTYCRRGCCVLAGLESTIGSCYDKRFSPPWLPPWVFLQNVDHVLWRPATTRCHHLSFNSRHLLPARAPAATLAASNDRVRTLLAVSKARPVHYSWLAYDAHCVVSRKKSCSRKMRNRPNRE